MEVVKLFMTYLCVTNKTKDLKIHVFQMITGKIESKVLTKDISCEFKYRFDGKNVIQIKCGTMINVNLSIKNVIYVEKIIFGM